MSRLGRKHVEFLLGVLVGMLHADGVSDKDLLDAVTKMIEASKIVEARPDIEARFGVIFKEFLPPIS